MSHNVLAKAGQVSAVNAMEPANPMLANFSDAISQLRQVRDEFHELCCRFNGEPVCDTSGEIRFDSHKELIQEAPNMIRMFVGHIDEMISHLKRDLF